ncbi:unnamed protein product [Cuscuta campestris]|uniref:Peptidase S8/S53 domain-containing protein n=1 Tax=Cuscuta campestris TaxID=132261 RepID=A0A484NRG0_9ASTE|nr:unnamed protein product [Cuscuta campestris]
MTENGNGVYIVYLGAVGAAVTSLNDAVKNDQQAARLFSSLLKGKRNALVHSYTNGFLGFAARLTEDEAQSIAREPEVVSVFPDPILQLHTTRSWDFLKSFSADHSWDRPTSSSSSSTGTDTIIGILDTGIWPESASFNDDGMGPITARWKGACEDGIDFNSTLCNRKIIGARYYSGSDESQSKGSARDQNGHGTHVASTAAGSRSPNASYYGLALGVADSGSSASRIAVYQVCSVMGGCLGSYILKGFDDAMRDGVDVLSLSVGGEEGIKPDFSRDPIAIGSFHAMERGIVVVCSAGNSGPDPSTLVNDAPWIFTVAASTIDRDFESRIVLGGGNKNVIKGGGIQFSKLEKTPMYPLVMGALAKWENASESDARECIEHSLDPAKVKGNIILCEYKRIGYPNMHRVDVVQEAGGVGIIEIVSDDNRFEAPKFETFPGSIVTKREANDILTYINSTKSPIATILPTVTTLGYKPAPVVIFFSSRGPSLASHNILKPDISAPGVDILAAWPDVTDDDYLGGATIPGMNPPGYYIQSGTSMSCPHISGIVASVKAHNPTFSVSAIRSAIMTTGNDGIYG